MQNKFLFLFIVFLLFCSCVSVSADPVKDEGWSDWWTVWNILEDVPVIDDVDDVDESLCSWSAWSNVWRIVSTRSEPPPFGGSVSVRVFWGLYPLEVDDCENCKVVKVKW